MIAENARDVPAWSSRSASPTQTIARALEKLQSALQKSGIDRATTWPTAEGAEVVVEGRHMSTVRAAWGRPRCPHVMTTTLCVNAQELSTPSLH